MKILIINGISALRGGGQTNLINLFEFLPNYPCKVIFILNSANFALFSKFESKKTTLFEAKFASKSIIHRMFWEKFILPLKLCEWQADIYYAPGGVMVTKVPAKCRSVTTLQNMLPFDSKQRKSFPFFSYLRFKLFLLRAIFLRSYKIADNVIFISKHSRDAIKYCLPSVIDKSKVIPLGINRNFINNTIIYNLPDGLVDGEFYLYVSHMDYYKSQKELVFSWQKLVEQGLSFPLVFAGPIVNDYGREVISLIKQLNLEKKVIHLGEIDYDALPGLYRASRGLIFASKCECCPNILLEMLASQKIILCSDMQPMPEFGEDGVVYFDPSKISQLPEKILAIECGAIKQDVIIKRANALSKRYGYDKTIDQTIRYILGQ